MLRTHADDYIDVNNDSNSYIYNNDDQSEISVLMTDIIINKNLPARVS